jgi:hypothetical protein
MDARAKTTAQKQAEIVAKLLGGSDEFIIGALEGMRDTGELFIVEPLIDLLFSPRSERLKASVRGFIEDIKEQAAAPIIAESLRKYYKTENVNELVSVCWQSRLDFSQYVALFVEILCTNDYQTALEAFTVIENSLENVPREMLDEYSRLIHSQIDINPEQKRPLMREMVAVIDRFRNENRPE